MWQYFTKATNIVEIEFKTIKIILPFKSFTFSLWVKSLKWNTRYLRCTILTISIYCSDNIEFTTTLYGMYLLGILNKCQRNASFVK